MFPEDGERQSPTPQDIVAHRKAHLAALELLEMVAGQTDEAVAVPAGHSLWLVIVDGMKVLSPPAGMTELEDRADLATEKVLARLDLTPPYEQESAYYEPGEPGFAAMLGAFAARSRQRGRKLPHPEWFERIARGEAPGPREGRRN